MSHTVATIVMEPAASGRRNKGPLAFRKLQRRLIRQTLQACRVLKRMDGREATKAEEQFYSPLLWANRLDSPDDRALARVIERCEKALAQRAT